MHTMMTSGKLCLSFFYLILRSTINRISASKITPKYTYIHTAAAATTAKTSNKQQHRQYSDNIDAKQTLTTTTTTTT